MNSSELATCCTGLIDRLVPPGYLELAQYEVILRARITVGILLLSCVGCLAAILITPDVSGLQADLFRWGRMGLWFSAFAFLADVLLFRKTGSFLVAANLYAATVCLVLYFIEPILGGPLHNPLSILIIIVPPLVFLMAGKYMGLLWTGVILAYFATMPIAGLQPQAARFSPEMHNQLQLATWAVLAIGFLVVIYIFDLFNTRLRNALADERNRFEFEARHDKLTGILNRSCFQLRLDRCLDRIQANGARAVVGLLDLDGFKPINDEIGHHAGDVVLKEIAARLQAIVRKTDTLARLGGDEFAFITEDTRDVDTIEQVVQQMLAAIAAPIDVDGRMVTVSGSIGLARCPEDSTDPEGILRAADIAMYEAKKAKGCFCHFRDVPLKVRPPRVGSRFA